MRHNLFIFYTCLVAFTPTFADSQCLSGYDVATHSANFDVTVNTSTYTVAVSENPTTKSIANTTFITSEDGFCPNGYTVYSRYDDYMYPIMESPDLCEPGYYRSNGNCVAYGNGSCPSDRYDSAKVQTTLTATEDGYCANGYVPYSRSDDYIYPLVLDNTTLCPSGQYPLNGTCTNYPTGTCPNDYYSYSLNNNTIVEKTADSCPSNYTTYTTMSKCDIGSGDATCADIATVVSLTWYDRDTEYATTTCTYNTNINLPATPTRVGYTFSGWKLEPKE